MERKMKPWPSIPVHERLILFMSMSMSPPLLLGFGFSVPLFKTSQDTNLPSVFIFLEARFMISGQSEGWRLLSREVETGGCRLAS